MKGIIPYKKAFAWALALLLLLPPAVASAAVNVSAAADRADVQPGDTVEVTVTVSGTGMSVAEGLFTYDPAVLTYSESEGGASDGFLNLVSAQKGGTATLAARIRFTAAGAGSTDIEVSIEKVLGYDGKEQPGAKADVSVSVSAPAPTPAPTPLSYAAEGVPAQNVKDASEPMYIWRSLENVTVPSRYSVTTLTYHGETVAAANVEDSDAPTLVYLSNAAGDVGGYYVFDAASDTLYPYRTVSSVSKSYILLEPDGSIAPPEGFTETTLMIGEKECMAWKALDAQGEIYLLYARNPDGETGYYLYNPEDESLQRYAVMPARPVQPPLPPAAQATPAPERAEPAAAPAQPGVITLSKTAFYLICGGGALLLLAVAALLLIRFLEAKRRRRIMARRRAGQEHAHSQEAGQ
ncbi:MAG TPA: cohesin domain-containing protein [Feifaniaceae bacterium]|nr:cohesin domain-containing protein [Feifaniaceae bacterium]